MAALVTSAFRHWHDAALGLQYLHERGIAHGNISLENILIGSDGIAKLANFPVRYGAQFTCVHPDLLVKRPPELDTDVDNLRQCLLQIYVRLLTTEKVELPPAFRAWMDSMSSFCHAFDERTLTSFMSQLKLELLTPVEAQESQPISRDDILMKLEDVEMVVEDSGQALYTEMFQDLDTVCHRILDSENSSDLSNYEKVFQILDGIQQSIEQQHSRTNTVQRLSSSCVGDQSFDFFCKQIARMIIMLDDAADLSKEMEKRWSKLRKSKHELFVSEVSNSFTLLRPTETEDLLVLLHKELQSTSYTASQKIIPRKQWFIGWYELENEVVIARGGFGEVSKAKWLNSDVIVKRVIIGSTNKAEQHKMFEHEIALWFRLNHPHAVKLFGGCHIGTPFFVCDEAKNGSLDKYLTSHPSEVWQKLYEAALGLEYLHARGIVHHDLKCDNILVGTDGNAKLTDFMLSSVEIAEDQGKRSGAVRWVAPECLAGEKASYASDIYSFGMCIIQAVSGRLPWGNQLDNVVVERRVKNKELPQRPAEFTDSQWWLVESMCKFYPSERMHLLVVVQRLKMLAYNPDVDIIAGPSPAPLLDKSLDELIQAMQNVQTEKTVGQGRAAARQIYTLLVNRIQDVYTDNIHADAKNSLNAIASIAIEWVARLKQTKSTMDLVKTIFRAFSLHRQVDRVLAEYFILRSSAVHNWEGSAHS